MTKLVTVHPGNASFGLPSIQGEVVAVETATGRRLGVLDGSVVTARRTAALSLLAAQVLAPCPQGPLLIVGAGTQGRAHLEAFREGLGVSRVSLVSRTSKNAELLAAHARHLGMEARVAGRVEEALEEAKLLVTATTSKDPVLPEEGLADDAFVAAVGAFKPEMAELPSVLVARCALVVDTLKGAKEEAGDLIRAERYGVFSWEDATTLEEVLRGSVPFPGRPVVFKSVGHSLWDLAAARAAFR